MTRQSGLTENNLVLYSFVNVQQHCDVYNSGVTCSFGAPGELLHSFIVTSPVQHYVFIQTEIDEIIIHYYSPAEPLLPRIQAAAPDQRRLILWLPSACQKRHNSPHPEQN